MKYFGDNENIIIRNYYFNDYESKKEVVNIIASFYIKNYKKVHK